MPARFVIQLHSAPGGAHYDLMLETEGVLATWRIDRPPTDLGPNERLPAEALPDHRLAYLSYEGPVSRGRGTVRIFDGGTYHLIDRSEGTWVFELCGRLLRGTFTLRRLRAERWQLLAGDGEQARSGRPVCPQ